jgi:hypothetical protein
VYWRCTPGGRGPLLHVPGLIDHQHPSRISQLLRHVAAHIITHRVGVPPRPLQQVLHPVRRRIASVLGDRPAVLARQARDQAHHERPRPPPRFHPAEPASDPAHQLIEQQSPAIKVYAEASGHRKIIMSRHKP